MQFLGCICIVTPFPWPSGKYSATKFRKKLWLQGYSVCLGKNHHSAETKGHQNDRTKLPPPQHGAHRLWSTSHFENSRVSEWRCLSLLSSRTKIIFIIAIQRQHKVSPNSSSGFIFFSTRGSWWFVFYPQSLPHLVWMLQEISLSCKWRDKSNHDCTQTYLNPGLFNQINISPPIPVLLFSLWLSC